MSRKFLIALLLFIISTTACGGGGKEPELPDPRFSTFDVAEFSLVYPKEWEVISEKDFTAEVPSGTVVAFRSNIRKPLFTPNVTVTKQVLPKEIPSIEFAKSLIQTHRDSLKNFKEISREELAIKVGDQEFPTLFVSFEGKEQEDADLKRFLQFSGVKRNTAYIVTGAFLPEEDPSIGEAILHMEKSFSIK